MLACPSRGWFLKGGDRGTQEGIHPLRIAKHCCHVWVENDYHCILGNLPRKPVRPRFGVIESILGREVTLRVAISRTTSLLHSPYAHVALDVER